MVCASEGGNPATLITKFKAMFKDFSPRIKGSVFSKPSIEKEEQVNPFGGKKPILDPDGSADQIIGIDTAGIDKLDQPAPKDRTDQEDPFGVLKFKYSPEETEMPEGKSTFGISHEELKEATRRSPSGSSHRSAPTNAWEVDSRLMNGGEESQANQNSEQTTDSNQEQRLEGGSVEGFLTSWGKSVLNAIVSYVIGEAVGSGSSGQEVVKAGSNAILSTNTVVESENKEEAMADEAITMVGSMTTAEVAGASAGLIAAVAIGGGLAARREIDKEGLQLAQNVCLGFAVNAAERQNCLHWGPDGPPASRAQAQAYRDSLFANQEDPSAIADEMWKNKDPLINPGSGSTDETGNYGSYDSASTYQALSRNGTTEGGHCFTGVTITFVVIDRDLMSPLESAELGFLINPGRGGDNDGDSPSQDQLPGYSDPSDPNSGNGGCTETL